MKNFRSLIKVTALIIFCWITIFPQSSSPFSVDEAPIQNNGQPINDFANVIDDGVEQQLNQKIKDFKLRTNPPIVLSVLTVKTTGDRPIFDYSLAVAHGWKIGSKFEDNPSALLVVVIDDRKYQMQVSRDLEDELPDGLAGQLQRQYLIPAFKQGDYTKGISDTIDAYIQTIEARQNGTATPVPTPAQKKNSDSSVSSIFKTMCGLVILFVFLIIIFSRSGGGGGGRNNRNRWGGGGFGGGALPWIVGSILANGGGSSGGSSDWGGSSGGGSDWGGFGGGGDFGGGGSGGSW